MPPAYSANEDTAPLMVRMMWMLLLVMVAVVGVMVSSLWLVLFVLLVVPLPVVPDLYLVCACSFSRGCDAYCVCRRPRPCL